MTSPDPHDARQRLGWTAVLALALGLFAARAVYLIWLSPYELAADEAHYWDWSRHLDFSYYSKGPGVAWLIATSTRLLGDAEWGVRLPAALSSLVTLLALARLAQRTTAGNGAHAAFLTAIAFCLVPVFLATSLLMTIDMPYLACWALASLAAWNLVERQRAGNAGLAWAVLLGLAIGVGFLFKYTILLILPGLLLYRLSRPSGVSRTSGALSAAICAGVVLATIQPVMIWNARHDWPTLAHLLGHLGLPGGDLPASTGAGESWTPMWFIEFVGAQLAIVGPIIVLMGVRTVHVVRRWRRADNADVFLVCLGLPIIAIYLGVSLMTDAEGNWAIAGYLTMCVLVARWALVALPHHAALVAAWHAKDPPRPKEGVLRRKPETLFQVLWHWSIGYALVAGLGMLALPLAERVPVLADIVPTHRLTGTRDAAQSLARSIEATHGNDSRHALVMADRYTTASLSAYYLRRVMGDDAPTVASAASRLGDRKSSYDFWPDTDVADDRWLGGTVFLVGGSPRKWNRGFVFDRVVEDHTDRWPVSIGFGYGGPRSETRP